MANGRLTQIKDRYGVDQHCPPTEDASQTDRDVYWLVTELEKARLERLPGLARKNFKVKA